MCNPFDAHGGPWYPKRTQARSGVWRDLGRARRDEGPISLTQFLGTHVNRLDAKGRVSIPAPFRVGLRSADLGVASVVLRMSHTHPCVECWPVEQFQQLATPLEGLDVFSEEHDDLAASIYADAYPIESDREGRIVLPGDLLAHANIGDSVVFMGIGRTFQIWEPVAAERRRSEARARTAARKLTLPGQVPVVQGQIVTQRLTGTPTT